MSAAPGLPSRFADVDGPVHLVELEGREDRMFVLVHGLGGSIANWLPVLDGLTRMGSVLAIDLPGFGLTPRSDRSSRLAANRRLLSRVIEKVVGRPVILVGNSMGGGISMLQAAIEPGWTEGLVLVGSVFPWMGRSVPRPPHPFVAAGIGLYAVPGVGELVTRTKLTPAQADRIVRIGIRMAAYRPSRIPESVVSAHVQVLLDRQEEPDLGRAFVEASRSLAMLGLRSDRLRPYLDAISCPVLVTHGHHDRLVPVRYALAAAESHPAWRLRIIPDAGHIPQLEVPDRWLDLVEGWLADGRP